MSWKKMMDHGGGKAGLWKSVKADYIRKQKLDNEKRLAEKQNSIISEKSTPAQPTDSSSDIETQT